MRPKRKQSKRLRKLSVRSGLLMVLATAVIAEIVVLSPSPLEERKAPDSAIDPASLIQNHERTLAPGIPLKRIPEYAINQFHYVSIHKGEKQWRLEADKANMYNPEHLVHSRTVRAYLFDPDGKITLVIGDEAKYFLNQRDLEIYGNVHTKFPDGFEVLSDYLRYQPEKKHIRIPIPYAVRGSSHEPTGQNLRFVSVGLDYVMGESQITLLKAAQVMLEKPNHDDSPTGTLPSETAAGVPNLTTIESDRCLIFRDEKLAKFTMDSRTPVKKRFVHITQPTLFTRSRRADLHYGDFSQVLQYLTAYEDVLVKEIGDDPKTLRYATGGKADFDTNRDVIILTEFPQAYQNQDTVAGDVILMHRETDIIEIEHSNAFSGGPE